VLLTDDVHAQLDTFITDEDGRPGDEFAHLVLALPAERTIKSAFAVARRGFGHMLLFTFKRRKIGLTAAPSRPHNKPASYALKPLPKPNRAAGIHYNCPPIGIYAQFRGCLNTARRSIFRATAPIWDKSCGIKVTLSRPQG
jgi:hypothetical protein